MSFPHNAYTARSLSVDETSIPPVLRSVDEYVYHHAASRPGAIAAVWAGIELTYARLAAEVTALADTLLERGVARGEVVAVYGDSRPECCVALLAAVRIGAVFLGVSPRSTPDEVRYQLEDAQPAVIVDTGSARRPLHLPIEWEARRLACVAGDAEVHLFSAGNPEPDEQRVAAAHAAVELDDPALLAYTSGSTGFPKGALLPHRALCACAHVMEFKRCELLGLEGRRSFVLELPISHNSWSTLSLLPAIVSGGTVVFRAKWDPAETLRAIERYKLNTLMFFPPQLMDMVDHELFASADLSSLTMLLPMVSVPPRLLETLRLKVPGAVAATGYGLTEAAGGSGFITGLGTPPENIASTVGRPSVPGLEHRLVGDNGEPVEPGQAGELWMRGPILFTGYLNRPEATAEVLDSDGWLHTSDVLVVGADGDWRIVGRKSEMFKSGGENVYPTEVERVLRAHPAVTEIAVVGAPDQRWGEVGVAFVISPEAPEVLTSGLMDFARRHLANFKIPKHVIVEPELPRLPNGKLSRTALRERAIEIVQG